MEQFVPHPWRPIQCQPADETVQTVNTQHLFQIFVTMTYHRQKPPYLQHFFLIYLNTEQ